MKNSLNTSSLQTDEYHGNTDSNSDLEKQCLEPDNKMTNSDLYGYAFRMRFNTLFIRQKEIVDFVRRKGISGASADELKKSGIEEDEAKELVSKGVLKTSESDENRFIHREFLTPKKH